MNAITRRRNLKMMAFVFLGGDSRAEQRRLAIAKSDTKARATTIDRAAKKKQIAESLMELEKNSKRKNRRRRI